MRNRRMWKITLYSVSIFLIIVLVAGGYTWYTLKRTLDAIYEPLPPRDWNQPLFEQDPSVDDNETEAIASTSLTDQLLSKLRQPDLNNQDPFCMLLLGVDEREGDRGRSDTMILLSVQPAKQSVTALSIPRDTRMLIPDKEVYDKINHAYAFGGTSLSVSAVERLFGIPIAYYMKTNMEGLVDIIDTLGGVDVNNEWAFTHDGVTFPQGEQHLEGADALKFVRMRKLDSTGDLGRIKRQRQVLSSAVEKAASFRNIGKLPSILSQLSKDVRTNLSTNDLYEIATEYKSAIKHVETLTLQGSNQMIDGIYYYAVKQEERKHIQELLLDQLQVT
ncbi:MAG: LCP family protein [Candidatus Cohnella colombiensis]|uniref:LCP family protein n=1 Tax=Candidatus Cohnella colombiensis TaxID=3121368 RepID=A0AA95EZJ0_9BACL|nr:MAG: LCP family protein [Cohnella sp.]